MQTGQHFTAQILERCFGPVLARHDAAAPLLRQLRRLVQAHAAALARLLVEQVGDAYAAECALVLDPGGRPLRHADHFGLGAIQTVLESATGGEGGEGRVYDAWKNCWQGPWYSGERAQTQYHLWDGIHPAGGRVVQPVTQSERCLVDQVDIEGMAASGEVDLAVDVYSGELGLTGWVSKRQYQRPIELPCLGYCLDMSTLLWINQLYDPAGRQLRDDYFVFFEWVEGERYGILGRRFCLAGGKAELVEQRKHCGLYRAQNPERDPCL